MAETFLFEIAGQILGKLATLSVTGTSLLWGMEKELNRLEITLSAIKAVLLDADEQQAKSQQVKDWLEKLNELLYDADDVLDDFATEALRQEMSSNDKKHNKVDVDRENHKAATGADNTHLDLDQLQIRLRDELMSRKFLLVLDDVWNEDPKRWLDLRDLLTCGAEGSRIIVTTRNKVVASIMSTSAAYELECLSNDECLSIFVKCAFKEGQENANPELLEIGKAIVNKCGGIPLAVRTLGSLLCTKTEERDWLYIKDNDILNISQKENHILPILRLSYDQMRSSLKQCFSYCSILPKDYHIPREKLINLWIAQGFVQSEESRVLEEIGNEYFNELLSRSFFQDVEEAFDCEVLTCRMHDLARSVARTLFSYVNFDTKSISKRVRHLLLCEENLMDKKFPGLLLLRKKLQDLARDFGNLCSLRHLYLKNCLKGLCALQSLSVSRCCNLESLSQEMKYLTALRALYIIQCPALISLPQNMNHLTSLEKLWIMDCEMFGTLNGEAVKGLKMLQSLLIRGLLPKLKELPCEFQQGIHQLTAFCLSKDALVCIYPENQYKFLSSGLLFISVEELLRGGRQTRNKLCNYPFLNNKTEILDDRVNFAIIVHLKLNLKPAS
ncbi:hypothetical protein AgCh_012556 [Apium graveolens]